MPKDSQRLSRKPSASQAPVLASPDELREANVHKGRKYGGSGPKVGHTRFTVELEDGFLRTCRIKALERGVTLASVVREGLQDFLDRG